MPYYPPQGITVPVPDTSAVTKGLALYAAGRRQNQLNELAMQKMAQDAAADQQRFELSREQIANQWEVQQAQIKNLNAEAGLRDSQAGYWENYKGKEAKDKQEALSYLGDMSKEIAAIPQTEFGTPDAANKLAQIYYNYADKGVFELPGGRQIQSAAELKQRTAERNLAAANVVLATRLGSTLRQRNLTTEDLDYLEHDDKTGFKPNQYWGVNKQGDPFITLETTIDPATNKPVQSVVPPATAQAKVNEAAKGRLGGLVGVKAPDYTYRTIKAGEAKQLLDMRNKVQAFNAGAAGPPIEAVQSVVADQQAQTGDTVQVVHPDGKTVGLIPRANLQKALERGYTQVQ